MLKHRVTSLSALDTLPEVDLLIYSVGYELRSRFVVESQRYKSTQTLAIIYRDNHTLAFSENEKFARDNGFLTVNDNITEIEVLLKLLLGGQDGSIPPRSIAVDVSAMNRSIMAAVIVTLLDNLAEAASLTLRYAPAKFMEPELSLLPIRSIGIAHPAVSGTIARSCGRI